MRQQGVHPEDAEGTSDASSRPDTGGGEKNKRDEKGTAGSAEESGSGTSEAGDAEAEAQEVSSEAEDTASHPSGPEKRQAGQDCDDEAHADEVEGDEPLLPARVHRPSDLMRLLVGVLAIAVLLAIAAFAHGTTSGLEQDINKGTGQAPDLLIKIAGLASSIAILLVPVAFAIERLIKRDGLRIADGVLAAVLAHGVTLATDLWVAKGSPGSIQEALTQPSPG
jgi:hypothetical protein